MEYNKTQFSKASDKKVLHKVRKHWVVLSTALLMALGGGAALTGGTTSANADANANSNNNTNASSTNALKNRLNASLTKGYQSAQSNTSKSVNVNQVSSKALTNQASALHNRILANATNANKTSQSTTNGRRAVKDSSNNNVGAVLNNRIKASVNAPVVGSPSGNSNQPSAPTYKYNNEQAAITVAYLNGDGSLQKNSDNGTLASSVAEDTVKLGANTANTQHSANNLYTAPQGYKIVNAPKYNFTFNSDSASDYQWNKPNNAVSDANEVGFLDNSDKHSTTDPTKMVNIKYDNNGKITSGANWDKINNRPMVLLEPANGKVGHDIILNYVNESGKSLNNDWGTKSPSDVIYGGENEDTSKGYSNGHVNQYGNYINVLDHLKNVDSKDYQLTGSDANQVKKLYQFGDHEQNVTVPLTGKSFNADNPNSDKGYNLFTITANYDDNQGNKQHTLKVAKYIKGQIGSYASVTPSDVKSWLSDAATNGTNSHITITNDGSTVSGKSNIQNIINSLSGYNLDPTQSFNDNADKIYIAGDGNGQGLLENSDYFNNRKVATVANSHNHIKYNNNATFNFSANANNPSVNNAMKGFTVHFIDQNNHQVSQYTVEGQNDANNPHHHYTTVAKGSTTPFLNGKYGQSINLLDINVPANEPDTSNGNDYVEQGSDVSLPKGYTLDPGQTDITNYPISNNGGDIYAYINGNQVVPGQNGYGTLTIHRTEQFFDSTGNHPLANQKIDVTQGNKLVGGHNQPAAGSNDKIVTTDGNGFINIPHDSSVKSVGVVGQSDTINPDDYVPSGADNYATTSDAVDPEADEELKVVYGPKGFETTNGQPISHKTFNYKVTVNPKAAYRYPIYVHYVTPSDPYDDVTTNYDENGRPSAPRDTTVSDRGVAGAPFSITNYEKNVPKGYQFAKVLGTKGATKNSDDNTISNHFSEPASNGQVIRTFTNQPQNEVLEVVPISKGVTVDYVDQNATKYHQNINGGDIVKSVTLNGGIPGLHKNANSRYGETVDFTNGKLVNGNVFEHASDPEIQNAKVPNGYHITAETDNYTFNKAGKGNDTYYVMVAGDNDNSSNVNPDKNAQKYVANVHIHEFKNGVYHPSDSYTVPDHIDGDIGDGYTINANDFTPNGFTADPKNQVANGTIMMNGLSNHDITFNYEKNLDRNAQDLQGINVVFFDNGHEVGYNRIDPQKSDIEDMHVNVTDPQWKNPEKSDVDDGDKTNNDAGFALPMVLNSNHTYQLDSDDNTNTYFSDTHSNTLRLNVYDPANQVSANFIVMKNLKASDGNGHLVNGANGQLSQDVGEKGYKPEDKPASDDNNFFTINASDYDNVPGYYESASDANKWNSNTNFGSVSDGKFTDYGIDPSFTNFNYIATNSHNDVVPKNPNKPVSPTNPLVPNNGKHSHNDQPSQNPSDHKQIIPNDPNHPYNPPVNPNKPYQPNDHRPGYNPRVNPNTPYNPGRPIGPVSPSDPSDNPGGHNVGPRENVAMPIYVQYWHNGLKYGTDQRVDGYMGQFYQDITSAATIANAVNSHNSLRGTHDNASNFALANNQNLSYTISNQEQQVNLDLNTKSKYDDTFKLNINEEDPQGNPLTSSNSNVKSTNGTVETRSIDVPNNSSDYISPDNYNPDASDFKVDSSKDQNNGLGYKVSDEGGNLYINGQAAKNGQFGISNVGNTANNGEQATGTYYYMAKTSASDASLGNIDVDYWNGSHLAGTKTFPVVPKTNYKGEKVNVVSDGHGHSYVPSGYTIVPGQQENYYYNDTTQHVNIMVTGNEENAQGFTFHYHLIDGTNHEYNGQDKDAAKELGQHKIGESTIVSPSKMESYETGNDGNDTADGNNFKPFSDSSYIPVPKSEYAGNVSDGIEFTKPDSQGNNVTPNNVTYVYYKQGNKASDAGPLFVDYQTKDGNKVATGLVDGMKMNQTDNDVTNPSNIISGSLKGYTILSNQDKSFKFTNNNKTAAHKIIYVQGQQANNTLKIHRVLVNLDGSTNDNTLTKDYKNHHVGSDVTFTASDFDGDLKANSKAPYGYSPDMSDDAPATVEFTNGTATSPAEISFVYKANQSSTADNMLVRYFNEKGQYVGGGTISGAGRYGKSINVTDPDASTNNGIAGIAIPKGYHLAADGPNSNPNQRTRYTFDYESRVINLNVEGFNPNSDNIPSDIKHSTSDNEVTFHLHENNSGQNGIGRNANGEQNGRWITVHKYIKQRVGSDTPFNANDFSKYVNGYHATLSDKDADIWTKMDNNYSQPMTYTGTPSGKAAKYEANGNVYEHTADGQVIGYKGNTSKAFDNISAAQSAGYNLHQEHYIGRMYATPRDVYFNYNQNDAKAAPLKLIYLDQAGNQVGYTDTISGNLDQVVNIADPSDGGEDVPTGYTLDGGYVKNAQNKDIQDTSTTNGNYQSHIYAKAKVGKDQDLDYGLTNQPQTIYLHVTGTKESDEGHKVTPINITLIEHNADGTTNVKTTQFDPDHMEANHGYSNNQHDGLRNGSSFEVTPSDAMNAYDATHTKADGHTPASDISNFHASTSDVDQFGYVKSDGTLVPGQMTFSYDAGSKKAGDGIATVRYYDPSDNNRPVGPVHVVSGKLGTQIGYNTTFNGRASDNDLVPAGYTIKGTPAKYNFSNSPRTIFVPVEGNPDPKGTATLTVYSIVKKGNTIDGAPKVTHVQVGHGRIGDSTTVSPYSDKFEPSGTRVDPMDQNMRVSIDANGNLVPSNSISFVYDKKASVQTIGSVNVHYYTGDLNKAIHHADGNNQVVDNVTDHGLSSDTFDLSPYEDDVPNEINNNYHTTGHTVIPEEATTTDSNGHTHLVKNSDGSQKYNYTPVAANHTFKYGSGNTDVYINIAKD